MWPWYLRGLADLQSKAGREAAVQFQNLIDHRGVRPTSPLFPLAHLGLARAAALTGDSGKARMMYAAFLALWSGADPDIKSLKDARTEQAWLQ